MGHRAHVTLLIGLAWGCGPGDPAVRRAGGNRVETPETNEAAPEVVPRGGLALTALDLCASTNGTARITPSLATTRPIGEVGGVTWMLGHRIRDDRTYTTVLIALGATDDLVVHDLGVETLDPLVASSIEGDRIRVLWFSGLGETPRWMVVDVSDPDRPRTVQAPRDVPGLRMRGWIRGFASDGVRAIVAMSLADDQQVIRGESAFLIDATSGQRIRAWDGAVARALFADRNVGFVTTSSEQSTLTVVRPNGDEETSRVDVPGGCATERFARADGLDVVVFGRQAYGGWRVGHDGSVETFTSDQWPSEVCRDSPAAHGEVMVDGRLVRREGERFVATAPLVTDGSGDAMVAGDELLVATAINTSGMMHSPTDERGTRRYYEWYSFTRADVARISLADGALRGHIALPFAAREGNFDSGPHVSLMRRGERFAAILTGEGGLDAAEHLEILGPCPAAD